jgi:hypothetical protein
VHYSALPSEKNPSISRRELVHSVKKKKVFKSLAFLANKNQTIIHCESWSAPEDFNAPSRRSRKEVV